jgi:F-type H+-transporting ATPase subunit a
MSFGPLLTMAAANPVGHVVNHPFVVMDGWWVWTGNQGNLVLSGLIMLLLGPWIARHVSTGSEDQGNDRYVTKNVFAHMVEVICVYLRESTVKPLLGKRTDSFMPFLWTLFFFILVNNLLGLIPIPDLIYLIGRVVGMTGWEATHRTPIGGTATQNLFVTGILALISFLVINGAGIKELGVGGYIKHLTGGAPAYIWPILVPVEMLGVIIKPFALAIRLFANMTAGHILLATLFMFVGMSLEAGLGIGVPVTAISIVGSIGIMFLELFVAFLQAFIFMFLTAVFISMLEHHEEHHEEPALAH